MTNSNQHLIGILEQAACTMVVIEAMADPEGFAYCPDPHIENPFYVEAEKALCALYDAGKEEVIDIDPSKVAGMAQVQCFTLSEIGYPKPGHWVAP
tara:strand:+ start:4026 stop:4313 length:288 start_codon:yes stop_codon:yes gene_type:complete